MVSGREDTWRSAGTMELWHPLILFRSRHCQNPLDKVYAFLALMEQQ
jgi:hypothetical protein